MELVRKILKLVWKITKVILFLLLLLVTALVIYSQYSKSDIQERMSKSAFIQSLNEMESTRNYTDITNKLIEEVHSVTKDDNELVVEWLKNRLASSDGPYFYLIRLYDGKDKNKNNIKRSLRYFVAGQLIYHADAARCNDPSSIAAVTVYESVIFNKIQNTVKANKRDKEYLVSWALKKEEKLKDRKPAMWICSHGIKTFTGDNKLLSDEEWEIHRNEIRELFKTRYKENHAATVTPSPNETFPVSHTSLTRVVKQWQPKKNHPATVTFSPNGKLLAVANTLSKNIRFFSVPEFKLVRTFGKPGAVDAIAFSPNSEVLAAGSSFSGRLKDRNSIRLWNVQSGEVIWEPPGFIEGSGSENDVNALVFDPVGKSLLVSLKSDYSKNSFRLFLLDLKKKTAKSFCTSSARSVAFSPNGDRIVSGGYGGVKMWSSSGEKLLWEQAMQNGNKASKTVSVDKVEFSPDGSQLLVSAGRVVTVLSAVDGHIQTTLPITPKYSTIAIYSPDGKYIAAVSDRLWILDASSLNVLEESELPKSADSLSFSPNGSLLSVGAGSGYVVVREFINQQ